MTKLTKAEISALSKLGYSEEQIKTLIAERLPTVKARSELPIVVTKDEYEGNQMIVLKRGATGRPFSFGKMKAQMIIEAYEQIKLFGESN